MRALSLAPFAAVLAAALAVGLALAQPAGKLARL